MSSSGFHWNSNGQCPQYGDHQAQQYAGQQLQNDMNMNSMQQTYPYQYYQQLGHAPPPPPPPPPPYPNSQQNYTQVQGYGVPSLSAPMTTGNRSLSAYPQSQSQRMYNYMQQTPQVQMQSQHYPNKQISQPPPPPPPPKQRNNNKNKKRSKSQKLNPILSDANTTTCSTQQYSCDVCSVSFSNNSSLQAHISAHISCKHTGCSFTGSKQVVSGHYKSCHGKYSGRGLKTVHIQTPGSRSTQSFRICVGNHPDDLKAWIAERKKKFPTREKIRQKEESRKRRREEGAVVPMDHDATRKGKVKEEENSDNKALGHQEVARCDVQTQKKIKIESDSGCVKHENDKVKPINALQNLVSCYDSSSSDDDNDTNDKAALEKKRESRNSIPSMLESSSSSKHDEIATPVQHDGMNQVDTQGKCSTYKTKQCRYFIWNGTCKNGDNCSYIHDMAKHEAYKANQEERKRTQSQRDRAKNEARKEMQRIEGVRSGTRGGNAGSGGGQTLLRQLLQNDIKRERTLCLQLLRYIVDCNFLQEQKGVKKPSEDCVREER